MKKFILSLFVWSIAAASFAQVSKTVTLTTAGTLADSLAGQKTTITDLSISGPINATDLTFIKGMTALQNIDMSGASGVTDLGETFKYNRIITSIIIPNSVTSIGYGAFFWCLNLKSVTIPNSVTYIGKLAFYYCDDLTSVTIPNSLTHISEGVFMACFNLTSITIPNSVTSIGDNAF